MLGRAIETAELALGGRRAALDPRPALLAANERHYGALQGKDKAQIRLEFGDEQFMLWRRSYDVPPPPLAADSELAARRDPRYARARPRRCCPQTECLRDVLARVLPYWHDAIVPALRGGALVLVSAHGNSLRALVKHLDAISDDEIAAVNLPTGIPLLYELDARPAPAVAGRSPLRPQRRLPRPRRRPPPRSRRSRSQGAAVARLAGADARSGTACLSSGPPARAVRAALLP